MRPSSIVFLNDFCIRYIQSEIKNLVTHGASGGECWGAFNNTAQTGWGAVYANNCIYSGSNDYTNGNTVWYNYTTASAGTIVDKNTTSENPATNTNTATESVCPNGWSLPSYKQIRSNTNVSNFNPVLGGSYINDILYSESEYSFWWGAEASTSIGAWRYILLYNGSNLEISATHRLRALYIRCVSEEKTVTDLTYMQDMTPKIAPALSLCI